jgi:O-antigen/teichoic acid export membrane protein
LRGRFARGAVWSLVGALLSQGANLAASIVTGRFLGPEGFGKYGIIQSTVGMLGVFAGLGLGVTATKYVAEFRRRDPERAGRIIALSNSVAVLSGGLLALLLLVLAPMIAAKTLNAPELTAELRIASLFLFFSALNGAQIGALSGFEAFRRIARVNMLRGLAAFPIAALGVLLFRLPGAVWALGVTSIVTCVLSQAALRGECKATGVRPRLSGAWGESRILWRFSTPAFLCSALVGPVTWAANTMLVNQSDGYTQMGMLSAASQWRYAIAFVPGVLTQFALPVLSNLNGERDASLYGKALRWNLSLTSLAAIAVALPVALSAPLIMRLYGHGFQDGSVLLVLSAVTAVISSLNGVVGTAILSAASVWVGFAFNAMWALVFLGGCYWLVPANLAVGLMSAMLAAYVAHTTWQAAYLLHLRRPQVDQ